MMRGVMLRGGADAEGAPRWLPAAFVLLAAPVLFFLALAVPPGEVPDEVAHILRADSVRHGEVSGFREVKTDVDGGERTETVALADTNLLSAGFTFLPGIPLDEKRMDRDKLRFLHGLRWSEQLGTVSIPNTAVYSPVLYLPSAGALQVAQWLGYGPYAAILAARLANCLCYVIGGGMALRLARRGRTVLFGILCLPMSLSVAASVNQDGLVIACAALGGALLLGRPACWWGGTAALGVAALAKPYLLPLALIVPLAAPAGLVQAIAGFAAAAGPAAAWAAAMSLFVAAPFARGAAEVAGPLYAGPPGTVFATTDPAIQAGILLAAPSRLVSLPLQSLWAKGDWLWREMVGVLGTLDVVLPGWLYLAWGWVGAAALLAGLFGDPLRSGPTRHRWLWAVAAGAGIASVWLACVLQYLNWTRIGAAAIDGVQGRYLLPVAAAVLPMVIPPVLGGVPGGRLRDAVQVALALPVVVLVLADAVLLPLLALDSYYIK